MADLVAAGWAAWFAELRAHPTYGDEPRSYFVPSVPPTVGLDPDADSLLRALEGIGDLSLVGRGGLDDLELLEWLFCGGESPEPHVTSVGPGDRKPLWWHRLHGPAPSAQPTSAT